MTKQEFINFAKLDKHNESNLYHLYPMLGISIKQKKIQMHAMALNSVLELFPVVKQNIEQIKPDQYYLAVDYPATLGILSDFICFFFIENSCVEIIIMPYNNRTGERLDYIFVHPVINLLHKNFNYVTNLNLKLKIPKENFKITQIN